MSQAKHTSGPWFVNESRMTVEAHDPVYGNGIVIAKPNTQADAYIIAAAPDLLAALVVSRGIIQMVNDVDGGQIDLLAKIDAAIAKARGEV